MGRALLLSALVVVSSASFDPANFETEVLADKHVWLIEFSSKMCGSCNEFAPEWDKLAAQLTRVKTAKVSVDEPAGKALAEKLGVLEQGIPNVKFFMKEGSDAAAALTLVQGEASSARKLKLELKPLLKGLTKEGGDGKYLKGEGGLATIKSAGPCIEHAWCSDNLARTADDSPHSNCGAWSLACPCTCAGFSGTMTETSGNKAPSAEDKSRKQFLGRFTGGVVDSQRKWARFVAGAPRVFVVLFYAGRSGESRVFSRTWEALTFGMKRVEAATVDIESEGGRAVAEELGVMSDGFLPCIKLLTQQEGEPTTLMAEKLLTKKQLRAAMKPLLKDLSKDSSGFFLKADEADAAPDEL